MNENLCSFLLRAPKNLRQNHSSYLFQAFWDKCEQACSGVYDKEFEPTETSEISRSHVSDGSDDDDLCGRNETELSKLPLIGMLDLNKDPVSGTFVKDLTTNETSALNEYVT